MTFIEELKSHKVEATAFVLLVATVIYLFVR